MNVLPGIDTQKSKAKAVKLLGRLIETPRKTAAKLKRLLSLNSRMALKITASQEAGNMQ